MAVKAVCSYPGCNVLIPRTGGYRCPKHRTWERAPDTRPSSRQRGYTAAWGRLRNRYLTEHPVCEARYKCNGEPAAEVDHLLPILQGGEIYDAGNLQAICKRCHAYKTKVLDRDRRALNLNKKK